MANLLVTSRCNRRCSFCFARKRLSRARSEGVWRDISPDEFHRYMGFLKRSDIHELRLLGGEPTLHPDFREMVGQALREGFRVHVFTNGMMANETADFLASCPCEHVSALCNISPQACDTESLIQRREYALAKLGPRVSLGITVTSPDFEYESLLDVIKRHGLRKRLRIGVAQPIVGEDNEFLEPARYRAVGTALTQMARRCVQEDILIGFDCGLTLCMFSEEEIGILAACSEGFSCVCRPILDIGPQLDVWHCFPLSEILNTRLESFSTRSEILRYYDKMTRPYRSLGCRPECI